MVWRCWWLAGLPGDESSNDDGEDGCGINVISAPPSQPIKSILKRRRPTSNTHTSSTGGSGGGGGGGGIESESKGIRFADSGSAVRGDGPRNSRAQGVSGGARDGAACFNFSQSGRCRFGSRCKYSHAVAGFQTAPSNYTRYELEDADGEEAEKQQKSALVDCLRVAKAAAAARAAASGQSAAVVAADANRPPAVDGSGKLLFNAPPRKVGGGGGGGAAGGAAGAGGTKSSSTSRSSSKASTAAAIKLSLMDDDEDGVGGLGGLREEVGVGAGVVDGGSGGAEGLQGQPGGAVLFKKKKKRGAKGKGGNTRQRSAAPL